MVLGVALQLTCMAPGVWAQNDPPAALAVPKLQGHEIAKAQWQAIKPDIFTEKGSTAHLGEGVVIEGKLLSSKLPLKLQVPDDTTVFITHLNQADRKFLREFRRPPSSACVHGTIRAIDGKTRTLTVQSVGTWFGQ